MNTAEAILAGYVAGCGGTAPEDNPYHGNDALRDAWARGCRQAWDEHEDKLLRLRRATNRRLKDQP